MSVTATVSEDLQSRTVELQDGGGRTGKRRFTVVLDMAALTGPELAAVEYYVESALPVSRYDRHPAWPVMIARTVSVQRTGHDSWECVVGYSSAPFPARGDGGDGTGTSAPGSSPTPSTGLDNSAKATSRPPEVAFARRELTKILEADVISSAAVKNTVGDKFDPPVEVVRSRLVLKLKYWKPASWWNVGKANFFDSINLNPVNIAGVTWPARTLRVTNFDPKPVWEQEDIPGVGPPAVQSLTLVYEVSLDLEYDPDEWVIRVLNTGKRKLVSGSPEIIRGSDGAPVQDSVALTAAGAPVAPAGSFHYLTFNGYVRLDFAGLL